MTERIITKESKPVVSPAFNGGPFVISCFTRTPEGFSVQTRRAVGRTDGIARNNVLDDDAQSRLKAGMQGELKFNKAQSVIDARAAFKEQLIKHVSSNAISLPQYTEEDPRKNDDPSLYLSRFMRAAKDDGFVEGLPEDLRRSYDVFESERITYRQKGKKIGFRNISVDGNTITTDVKLVSFPVLNQFASSENSPEVQDLSTFGATSMVLRTADNRLLIQHRAVPKRRLTKEGTLSHGNAIFSDVPGVSAAGMLDASLKGIERVPGTPDPVDTDTLHGSILKEVSEELGLEPKDLKGVHIVGLAHETLKLHDEFLYLAESNLNAEEIKKKSQETNRNRKLGPADFEEKFFDIEATVENIEQLLTAVKCPIPPTHAATLVATGYSMVLEKKGKLAADVWRIRLQHEVKQNYEDIDRKVRRYYEKHPEANEQIPERYWGKKAPVRNMKVYDAAYAPDEQGLPSFEDAMIEAKLMQEDRRDVETAWLFDVDGVLSDPVTKTVPDVLIDQLLSKLQKGEPVCLNTGRSSEWINEKVTSRLKAKVQEKSILENLVVIAEFGATWDTFDKEGNVQHGKVPTLEVPQALSDGVKKLAAKYSDSMIFDTTKETHVTLEMKDGYDLGEFRAQQARVVEEYQRLLGETHLNNNYEVHADTISTNIRSPYVSKALGAARFKEFLRVKDIKAKKFKAFGDNVTDLEMADELLRKGENVTFIYVGENSTLQQARAQGKVKEDNQVVSIGKFTQGTIDYLAA